MARNQQVEARVAPAIKARLKAIAKDTRRTESEVVEDALTSFVAMHERQAAIIAERLAEVEAGAPTIDHADVRAWLDDRAKAATTSARARRSRI